MNAKIRSPIADGRFEITILSWLQNALKREPTALSGLCRSPNREELQTSLALTGAEYPKVCPIAQMASGFVTPHRPRVMLCFNQTSLLYKVRV